MNDSSKCRNTPSEQLSGQFAPRHTFRINAYSTLNDYLFFRLKNFKTNMHKVNNSPRINVEQNT